MISRSSLIVAVLSATTVLSKHCTEKVVPLNVTARGAVFGNQKRVVDDFDAIEFTQNATVIGRNYTDEVLTGYNDTKGTYNISIQYCTPSNATSTKSTLQLLTHGIGFDKAYWDWPTDSENYSYVDVATDVHGYATLSYDRLGTGKSRGHPDPYAEAQLPVELEVLNTLTTMARNGQLPGVNASQAVVHIGHSYGSVLSFNLALMHPNNTNGIVLTGYSQPPSTNNFLAVTEAGFNTKTARNDQHGRFKHLEPGYLTWSDITSNVFNFFYLPGSDRKIIKDAEAHKEPFTVGELLTQGPAPSPAVGFTGPALIVTGQQDAIFCGGNCSDVGNANVSSIPELVRQNLPNASAFQVLIQPDTGHALNLHYNATAAYHAINDFLGSQNF